MKVIELINLLRDMPHNANVMFSAPLNTAEAETIPRPEMVWDDDNSKWVVAL